MKLTLESTTQLVVINGEVVARVWQGETASGIKVHAYIPRLAVDKEADQTEFQKELAECRPPSPEVEALPLRFIL